MKEPLAITLLIMFGLAAEFGASALRNFGFVAFIVVLAVHVVVLAYVHNRFYREYALSAPKFVLCAAVPSVAAAVIGLTAVEMLADLGAFGPPDMMVHLDPRGFSESLFFVFMLFYAVCVLVGISIVLGLSRYLESR